MVVLQLSPRWKAIMNETLKCDLHFVGCFNKPYRLPTLLLSSHTRGLSRTTVAASFKKTRRSRHIVCKSHRIFTRHSERPACKIHTTMPAYRNAENFCNNIITEKGPNRILIPCTRFLINQAFYLNISR
uniref:Uncharacterized protein n=1 Tax=Triticum urartu TaxID=4572 RepID=A0A8R7UGN0_TRIUA